MAVDQAFYLVPKSIAQRAGVLGKRYRTTDNKYILDQKDLSRVRLTTEEFVEGLDVVKLTAKQAKALIAKNGYKRDVSAVSDIQPQVNTPETEEETLTEETSAEDSTAEPETEETQTESTSEDNTEESVEESAEESTEESETTKTEE